MPKIRYKFVDVTEYFICHLTLKEFKNLKELEVIEECEIIETNEKKIIDKMIQNVETKQAEVPSWMFNPN